METISERLRNERERLGYTQTNFAEIAGIARNTLVNYEAGRDPGAEVLATFANKCGLDALFVLTGMRTTNTAENNPESSLLHYFRLLSRREQRALINFVFTLSGSDGEKDDSL